MDSLLNQEQIKETGKFFDEFHQIQVQYLHYWQDNTLWDWEFWLSLGLSIIPWIIWFIFRKRDSEARLLLAGSFMIIMSAWLDFIGVSTGLWHYTGKVLPTIPTYMPWDFSLIPVVTMFWLQFKPNWNPILKAIIYSALASFVAEPLFKWIGLYAPENWSSFYSFIIYIVLYLITYRISLAQSFDELK